MRFSSIPGVLIAILEVEGSRGLTIILPQLSHLRSAALANNSKILERTRQNSIYDPSNHSNKRVIEIWKWKYAGNPGLMYIDSLSGFETFRT